jgi:CheY-like chemotaxis protein
MILKDRRIFIVEDNAQNRVIFQMMLMRHGARVEFERFGRDAVWRMGAFDRIDLIILDLNLADKVSGYDIYNQIRGEKKYDKVPVIAVSASDPAAAIPKVKERGFSGFIAKPIDDQRFPKQLAQVIAGEQVWDAGGRAVDTQEIDLL